MKVEGARFLDGELASALLANSVETQPFRSDSSSSSNGGPGGSDRPATCSPPPGG
jgi:hypothetical protein